MYVFHSKCIGCAHSNISVKDKNNANQDELIFKAGRTNNPKLRNGQWSRQCSSIEHHIVHVHPPSEDGNATSLMVADLNPGPPGICCHRLETLVLTELADLALYTQYLHPRYQVEIPKLKLEWEHLDQTIRDRKPPTKAPCKDCELSHSSEQPHRADCGTRWPNSQGIVHLPSYQVGTLHRPGTRTSDHSYHQSMGELLVPSCYEGRVNMDDIFTNTRLTEVLFTWNCCIYYVILEDIGYSVVRITLLTPLLHLSDVVLMFVLMYIAHILGGR